MRFRVWGLQGLGFVGFRVQGSKGKICSIQSVIPMSHLPPSIASHLLRRGTAQLAVFNSHYSHTKEGLSKIKSVLGNLHIGRCII